MAKKKNKALDKRNFDENKSESDGNEIKQSNDPGLGRMLAMAMQCQGQDEKCQNRHNGNDQQHSQHDNAQINAPVHAAACPGQNVFDHVPGFQGEKKNGALSSTGAMLYG